jgi:hypothetical protein
MFKLLSFDVYGTLMDTPPTNAKAFRVILEEAGRIRRQSNAVLSVLGGEKHCPLPGTISFLQRNRSTFA